jgi:hypothetical protein
MSETIHQEGETCITAERFYLGEWSLALIPFPIEQIEETLQAHITRSPSLRTRNTEWKIEYTTGQDTLVLKCSDGVCTCIVSPEWQLLSHDFVSSSITSLDFWTITFPWKKNIWNFLAEHLTDRYKYGEKIRLVFSNRIYIIGFGISSCEQDNLSSSDVISDTKWDIAEVLA